VASQAYFVIFVGTDIHPKCLLSAIPKEAAIPEIPLFGAGAMISCPPSAANFPALVSHRWIGALEMGAQLSFFRHPAAV